MSRQIFSYNNLIYKSTSKIYSKLEQQNIKKTPLIAWLGYLSNGCRTNPKRAKVLVLFYTLQLSTIAADAENRRRLSLQVQEAL